MTALDVGNVVGSTLGDTETTVTGLAVAIDEIIVEGNVLFTNGFINGVTDNSHLPGIVIEEESVEKPDMCFPTIAGRACKITPGFEIIVLFVGNVDGGLLVASSFSLTQVTLLLMLMLLLDSDNEDGIFVSKF